MAAPGDQTAVARPGDQTAVEVPLTGAAWRVRNWRVSFVTPSQYFTTSRRLHHRTARSFPQYTTEPHHSSQRHRAAAIAHHVSTPHVTSHGTFHHGRQSGCPGRDPYSGGRWRRRRRPRLVAGAAVGHTADTARSEQATSPPRRLTRHPSLAARRATDSHAGRRRRCQLVTTPPPRRPSRGARAT